MRGIVRGIHKLLTTKFSMAKRRPSTPAERESPTQPNILVIWGDDIGIANLSCYTHGLMGYRTPNIDRLANEGMMFTDAYGEQSCTAGRASFITGQSVFRTGLSKVGIPGAPVGLQADDPTIAELLKPLGYATGQFGKNHLGDQNRFLPTVHGFDEFFGNLYHLNAEEDPEDVDYPKQKEFKDRFGPRGVLHCWATDVDDPTEEPRWGRVGKQKIQDTGPLTRKRMETVDDEFVQAAKDFIRRQSEETESDYAFKHPLTQAVAYGSQLAESRARLHVAAARALQATHEDRLGQYAELLAHHFGAANWKFEAARWRRRAALRVTKIELPRGRR